MKIGLYQREKRKRYLVEWNEETRFVTYMTFTEYKKWLKGKSKKIAYISENMDFTHVASWFLAAELVEVEDDAN